jgi:bacillopeptidase F
VKTFLHAGLWLALLVSTNLSAADKITDRLAEVIEETGESGSPIRAIAILEDRYDLEGLDRRLRASGKNPRERARTVISELQDHASRTQAPFLRRLQKATRDELNSYHPFWIANLIAIEARPDLLLELSRLPGIAVIDRDVGPVIERPVRMNPAPEILPGNCEPTLKVINAHRMWQEGYTGAGTIVMNLDSGVDGNHPALAQRWRGNHVPPSEAWFDPDYGTTFPVDYGSHGTHTMGTITGLDPVYGDTIGVAPGAEWIAAVFSSTDEGMVAALEWALDPDGDPSTTDDMPIVVNNSWHWDLTACETPFNDVLYALEVAGIAVVFSAGNTGPLPVSVNSPAKINTTEMTAFCVGALDGYDPMLPIMDFSSRGPTDCSGAGRLFKPEISAPGERVRSSFPGGIYEYGTGTSMAAPHAAGAIALLKEAYPGKTGTELLWMLYGAGRDLGDLGEDNDYGMGVIDVYDAYRYGTSPGDPRQPMGAIAASDYTTPVSIDVSWTDPSVRVDGDTLTNFRISVWRNGESIGSVLQGQEGFTDEGLTDGTLYEYELRTWDLETDSLGMPAVVSAYAGGSPFPAAPSELTCTYDGADVILNWADPTTQSDSTPIDDLAMITIYRDDTLIDSVSAGVETYIDSTVTGGTVHYYLRAVDDESPPNWSEPSERVPCFIGDAPDFLVWVGPDGVGPTVESANALFDALEANGEVVFLTDDLFEFGTDLGVYEAIFVVLGTWWNNHVLENRDPEPGALEEYLRNGGRLYLEGSDCYNYDPIPRGGYNIRPWFSLAAGDRGTEDVLGVEGSDYFSSFSFDYRGANQYMDVLNPVNSTIIWRNDENGNVCGVWNAGFGSGLAIGVVPSFGGLVDTPVEKTVNELMAAYLALFRENPPYARDITVNATYLIPGVDTLIVTGEVVNPDSHDVTVQLVVESLDPGNVDSIPMFDDGNHFDGAAGDGIYGTSWPVPSDENSYNTRIVTHSLTMGTIHNLNEYVTSIGPVVLDGYTYVSQDTIPNPGDVVQVRLRLRNSGSTATALDVSTGIAILDTCASILFEDHPFYGDIEAGDTASAEGWYLVEIGEECPGNEEIRFLVDIASDERSYWVDTLGIYLYPVGIGNGGVRSIPLTFALDQNYPNPFNPSTTIEYAIPPDPGSVPVKVTIYDLRGRVVRRLVDEPQVTGVYKIRWDGRDNVGREVGSGVYLYRIKAGSFESRRKMVLLK